MVNIHGSINLNAIAWFLEHRTATQEVTWKLRQDLFLQTISCLPWNKTERSGGVGGHRLRLKSREYKVLKRNWQSLLVSSLTVVPVSAISLSADQAKSSRKIEVF